MGGKPFESLVNFQGIRLGTFSVHRNSLQCLVRFTYFWNDLHSICQKENSRAAGYVAELTTQ